MVLGVVFCKLAAYKYSISYFAFCDTEDAVQSVSKPKYRRVSEVYSMNIIFAVLIIASGAFLVVKSPESLLSSMTTAAESAISLTLKMVGIYAIWLGISAMLERSGLSEKLSNLLKPVCKKLFGKMSEEGYKYTTMNLSANILGLGNAATPMGIKSVGQMKDNTYQLAMLMVINATSIQILPTTVLSLLTEYSATNPASIILPSLIGTAVSTIIGVLLVVMFFRKRTKKDATCPPNSKLPIPHVKLPQAKR